MTLQYQKYSLIFFVFVFLVSCNRYNTLKLTDSNYHIADSLAIEKLIALSNENIANNLEPQSLFDKYLKEAEDIAVNRSLKRDLSNLYIIVGKRYRERSIYSQGYDYLKKALDIAIDLNDYNLQASCYNQIAVIFRRTGDLSLAMDLHLKAEQYASQVNDTFNICVSLNGIGNVNLDLKHQLTAMEYFNEALNLSILQNNLLGQAINYNNIGEVFLLMGEYDKAIENFNKSLKINISINSYLGQLICNKSIGKVYLEKEEYFKALSYFHKAFQISNEKIDLIYIVQNHILLGDTYLRLNDSKNAMTHLYEGLKIAKKIGARQQVIVSCELLGKLYEEENNYLKALLFFKKQSLHKDTLLQERSTFHISNIEAIYQSEKQKLEIQKLNRQNEIQSSKIQQQKGLIIVIVLASLFFLFLLFLIVRQNQLREKFNTLIHRQRLLRSQMNPHFIFNSLSAIQVFILEHDFERSSRYLSEFSKLLRQVLQNSNNEYITLKEELETLKYYTDLQNLRFTPPFNFDICVDNNIDPTKILIPPMLTQPFIENSIEHGLQPIGGDGFIFVRFTRDENQLYIEVEDNGIGIDQSMHTFLNTKKHQSLALRIIKERLDVVERRTKKQTSLIINDKSALNLSQSGTLVKIVLPIIEINQKPGKDE
ncbi:MAG: tetratricopeptide repeat protein [Marinilabiliaceae bacterium]|nr:tetratricopeptide repeat protein [Marinilabiliaceae bacterium]